MEKKQKINKNWFWNERFLWLHRTNDWNYFGRIFLLSFLLLLFTNVERSSRGWHKQNEILKEMYFFIVVWIISNFAACAISLIAFRQYLTQKKISEIEKVHLQLHSNGVQFIGNGKECFKITSQYFGHCSIWMHCFYLSFGSAKE